MMMKLRCAVVTALLLLTCATGFSDDLRTWTSASGSYQVVAKLTSISAEVVTLKTKDGKQIEVPLEKLSVKDRIFVKSIRPSKNPTRTTAKEALRRKGVWVTGNGLRLADEAQLSKGLRASTKKLKILQTALGNLAQAEQRLVENRQAIRQRVQLYAQLNDQLARLPAGKVATGERVKAMINANVSKLKLLQETRKDLEQRRYALQAAASEAREAYIQYVLDLRDTARDLETQYDQLVADPEVQAAIKKLNSDASKKVELTKSRNLKSSLGRLKELEKNVLTDSIPLHRDRGGTLTVSVVVNGKKATRMVVDSGASLISMPKKMADEYGIRAKQNDPAVKLKLADGGEVAGRLVRLQSVRVGPFTVNDVKCVILGEEAANAEPLLGMSFLGNFKFELNAQKSQLTLTEVKAGATGKRKRNR